MRSTMRSFDSPISISASFYGNIKFFKLLRTESRRNKDVRSALTDSVILAAPYRYFGIFTWPTTSLNTKDGFEQSFLLSYNSLALLHFTFFKEITYLLFLIWLYYFGSY